MSLQVDDGGRRARSRSPSGRERERDHSRSRGPPAAVVDVPYPDERDGRDRGGPRIYDYEDQPPRSPAEDSSYRRTTREDVDVKYSDGRHEKEYRYEKERDRVAVEEDKFAYLPQKYAKATRAYPDRGGGGRDSPRDSDRDRGRYDDDDEDDADDKDLAYGSTPVIKSAMKYSRPEPAASAAPSSASSYAYAQPKQWEYEKTEKVTYADHNSPRDSLGIDSRYGSSGRAPSPGPQYSTTTSTTRTEKDYYRDSASYAGPSRSSANKVVTVEPGARRPQRDSSPLPPTAKMSSLKVNTGHHSMNLSLSSAPGSPLLESYHGTYQSMSPMPSPLLMASHGPGGVPGSFPGDPSILDISPAGSDDDRSAVGDKPRRRARFHDPEEAASQLAKALKGDRHAPDTAPLIEILPGLTHEQVMELRVEYKRLVKTGPERKGVNIAKHIRSRLKDEDPLLMKACYATALGRWESEAYWANFWYQGDKTRRELLIEALMGRTNAEVRLIKDGFSDKKYGDSLTRCMKTELKEDKFKRAVLLVLEERRMEETDRYGRPLPVDRALVEEDARALYKAAHAEKGGETAMVSIVVQRSDAHLREVLRVYASEYRGNFARDALKKSGNLVGELLAHILNGVINRPVRDALLLHHAVTASKRDGLRRELLISRLVRVHWDRQHMAAVKAAYRERYGRDLADAVRDAVPAGSDWGAFCRELCISRMPDDVKRVERIEIRS